jgi:transcription elongation factor GreA
MQKELLTSNGFEKLTAEIKRLTNVERPKIIEAVQAARELGDLKENAEYHSAKEKQGLIDKEIADLNNLLTNSQIVDPSELPHTVVSFGSTVTLLDLDSEEEFVYTIVGTYEADIDRDIISISSPIAGAIMGKEVGEEAEVLLPNGEREFEILKIEYIGERLAG